jgi:catechol 2,3-dioxygenase-like lactoylglutathione lyase family enzyme
MKIQRMDHVGIIVNDLPAARAFFLDLGLEVEGEGEVSGEVVDRVIGLDGARSTLVFLRPPGGGTAIELVKFITPQDERGIQPSFANTLGIRHIAFLVDDIEAIVARLKESGTELFGEIQNYEDTYKLCYVRGPEGIIVELAERIN